MKQFILAATIAAAAQAAAATEGMVTYKTDQSFDDVTFGLESAILDQGLVIDATSHVGEMLERTRGDVGSDIVIFEKADVFSFCSAKISREVMEADPMNIVFCPYDIFVAVRHDMPDETIIGYREFPDGDMQKVQALLDQIVRAAIGLE